MLQEAIAECSQSAFHAIPQPLAYATVAVQPVLIVAFEQAVVRRLTLGRQARAVQQAIHLGEGGVLVALDNALDVELDVCRACEQRGVAQQTELVAVGYDPPERVRVIQVILHKRMRAAAVSPAAPV